MSENKAIPVKANERPKHAPTHRGGPGPQQPAPGQRHADTTPATWLTGSPSASTASDMARTSSGVSAV